MFECHITFEDVSISLQREITEIATDREWKVSTIDGDPDLGPGKRLFLTAHDYDVSILKSRMVQILMFIPVIPTRKKIEHIVYDTKHGIGV